MASVQPLPADRDDLRAAVNTAALRNAMSMSKVSDEEYKNLVNALRGYLPTGETETSDVPFDAAALELLNQGKA